MLNKLVGARRRVIDLAAKTTRNALRRHQMATVVVRAAVATDLVSLAAERGVHPAFECAAIAEGAGAAKRSGSSVDLRVIAGDAVRGRGGGIRC